MALAGPLVVEQGSVAVVRGFEPSAGFEASSEGASPLAAADGAYEPGRLFAHAPGGPRTQRCVEKVSQRGMGGMCDEAHGGGRYGGGQEGKRLGGYCTVL